MARGRVRRRLIDLVVGRWVRAGVGFTAILEEAINPLTYLHDRSSLS